MEPCEDFGDVDQDFSALGAGGGPLKSGLKRKKIGSVNTDNFFKQFQWGQ